MSMDEIRDPEIGDLLSGGSVAEHEAGYWDALRETVAPEFAALELAALHRPRPRKRRLLRMGLAAAAVAAAAAVFTFAVLPALHGTDPATAADMLASMSRASSPIQTVRLRVVEGLGVPSSASASPASSSQASIDTRVNGLQRKTIADLILSTNGDFRASQATEGPRNPNSYPGETRARPGQYGYDASRHELRIDSRSQGNVMLVRRPCWPTGGPDPDVSYLSYQVLANSVRAALAEADPNTSVRETTYLGRPAWTASVSIYAPGVERRVTVDQATGLLLAIDLVDGHPPEEQLVRVLRVTRLEVDPDLPAGWEVVPLLEKARAFTRSIVFEDDGTRFGSPESVAKLASPTPLLIPQWVPAGYRRAAAAAAVFEDPRSRRAPLWKHVLTIPPQGSTPGTDVTKLVEPKRYKKKVVVQFRRGFDTFTVQVSPGLPGEGLIDEHSVDDPDGRDVTLTGGYLNGATARTWISSTYIYRTWDGIALNEFTQGPTLLAFDRGWKVVISGGLTRQELVDVANSLKTYGE
jgi:hypothetical protein